jgi:hypothetical protein
MPVQAIAARLIRALGVFSYDMDRNIFQDRLVEASAKAISWAREHVINQLPSGYLYLLYPNQSYDGNPLQKDEEIFPEESLPNRKFLGPLTVEQAVEYL